MASNPQSIINIANSMFSGRTLGAQGAQNNSDDRLDAAHALLGVSPASSTLSLSFLYGSEQKQSNSKPAQVYESSIESQQRLRSNSTGLEALALLATEEQEKIEPVETASQTQGPNHSLSTMNLSSSSDEDSEAMPPPRPRPRIQRTRRRSVSNPEGMDKWAPEENNRLHFVLPASILEEELAEASAAMKAKEEEMAGQIEEGNADEEEEVFNEDELLRRARSRLLEDLSQGNLNGEKGVLTLPHSLEKYKQVCNGKASSHCFKL